MTLEEWNSLLDAIKVALECIAIVGIGVWAAYTFGSLRQIAKAKAEITKLDSERRKTEAEIDRLAEQARIGAVIQITLEATPRQVPGHDRQFIEITVEVSNAGSRNVHIAYPDFPLCIYAVEVDSAGGMTYQRVAAARVVSGVDPNGFSKGMLARVGGRYPLSFMIAVPKPGLYLAVFSVPLSEAEQSIATQFGFSSKGRWSGKKYVTVPTTQSNAS